jgi:4-amino-4-deoxychorismate lyase
MPHEVLALLNQPSTDAAPHTEGAAAFSFVDTAAPQVNVLDLGVSRGDGIFETISVGHGNPQALEHHLLRFARSAQTLDLPAPDLDAWRATIAAVIAELQPGDEAWVKTVMTRGVEGDGRPTGWVYATHSADFSSARVGGVSVVLLDRGYRHDVEQTSPWLLQGAKTLSYAVNRSVFREAHRRGADDVIFVSSDGYVLEGPTSTVVYRRGSSMLSPGTGLGILDGTTQANVFRYAESLGMTTGFELITPAELAEADDIWLVSSVRLAAPVRALDGVHREVDVRFANALNDWLLHIGE